jgi:hypothetical protein
VKSSFGEARLRGALPAAPLSRRRALLLDVFANSTPVLVSVAKA